VAFYQKTPALRLVNSSGAVIAGPLSLYQPAALTQGIICTADCKYPPELLGPWHNLAYQTRLTLLGYRPSVSLSFPLLAADGASGMALLYQYYTGAFAAGYYAALQFNLFSTTCSVWRGMFPTSAWEPRPLGGKQRTGYELDLTLEARDLINAPGDWTAGTW
jgi:hypothetical protein